MKSMTLEGADNLAALMNQLESIDLDAEVRKLGLEPSSSTEETVGRGQASSLPTESAPMKNSAAERMLSPESIAPPTARTIPSAALKAPRPHMQEQRFPPPGSDMINQPTPTASDTSTEVAALREQSRRQAAKFDNYRKRISREKADAVQFANERLIKDLLPSLDNLSLALEHLDTTNKEQLALGVKMTMDMLTSALSRHGLEGFDSLSKVFDPRYHQALNQVDDPSVPANTVVKVAQRGYTLHGRLMRPALVTVAVGSTTTSANTAAPADREPQSDVAEEDLLDLELELDSAEIDDKSEVEQASEAIAAQPESVQEPDAGTEAGNDEYDLEDLQDALDAFLSGD